MTKQIHLRVTLSTSISDAEPSIDVMLDEGQTIIDPLHEVLQSLASSVEATEAITARFEAPYPLEVTVYWEGTKTARDVAIDLNNEINSVARVYIILAIENYDRAMEFLNQGNFALTGMAGDDDWKSRIIRGKKAGRRAQKYQKRWLAWLIITGDAALNWVGEDTVRLLK